MSVKTAAPVRRISEGEKRRPDQLSLRGLRDAVAGKDVGFSRQGAMAGLLASDFPNKDHDFAAVLENEQEAPRIRYLAAVTLAKVETPAAQDLLIRSLRIRDQRVRAGVLVGLGRIGDQAALEAIERQKDNSREAHFAAALIAHRIGAVGHDLPVPEDRNFVDLPANVGRPVQWERPAPSDVEVCLRSLVSDPFGVRFAEDPAYQIRCGNRFLMALFNRELVAGDTLRIVRERKTIAGVVALRNETNGLYSVSLLLLTSPDPKTRGINLLLHQTKGQLAYGARVRVREDAAEFSIRALPRPGAIPVQVEGIFQAGKVEITSALSAMFVQSRRQPSPWPPNRA
ncbi:MAG: HEAT repeat domain-containing protein [Pyrinomonadaceae bacterium]